MTNTTLVFLPTRGCRIFRQFGCLLCRCVFFFFQAEDGIRDCLSDWSSDVCSSDLGAGGEAARAFLALARIVGRLAEGELVGEGISEREAESLPGRAAIAADAARWKRGDGDRKSTRLNSSHLGISYAVFCLKTKNPRREAPHQSNDDGNNREKGNADQKVHKPRPNTHQARATESQNENTPNE